MGSANFFAFKMYARNPPEPGAGMSREMSRQSVFGWIFCTSALLCTNPVSRREFICFFFAIFSLPWLIIERTNHRLGFTDIKEPIFKQKLMPFFIIMGRSVTFQALHCLFLHHIYIHETFKENYSQEKRINCDSFTLKLKERKN